MYDFQKANVWKRISAYLFDFIILAVLAVGMALLLSTVLGYETHTARLVEIKDTYAAEYNVDLDITIEEYEAMSEEELELYNRANEAFSKDSEANYVYGMIFNLTFIIITFSLLISFFVLEFLVPLYFKNGQTLGKKIFGLAVMREDGVRITPVILFARTILGKCTVETMVPVFTIVLIFLQAMGTVGLIILGGLLIIQIALILGTKARTPIHDKLAHTVTVDFASQMIFDTPEELLAYKKRIHAEQVESKES